MNQKTIMFLLLVLLKFQIVNAQNNPIFYGGNGDGWHINSITQNSNSIFIGGNGDGFTTNVFLQNSNDAVYFGGNGNGWTSLNFTQNSIDNRYLGGNGDGWINDSFQQASIDNRFIGGNGDGWIIDSFQQASIDNRFIGGNGDGWASIVLPISALPINLLSFTAHKADAFHVLNWSTTHEKNSSHFVIEHSTDAVNFFELGMKNAAGNSDEPLQYSFTNKSPNNGNNFYRIKMVDINESYIYSNIILLKEIEKNTNLVIYPNPSADKINILVEGENENTNILYQIFDISGKRILQNQFQNLLNEHQIDISNFANGIYQLQVNVNNKITILKFQKTN